MKFHSKLINGSAAGVLLLMLILSGGCGQKKPDSTETSKGRTLDYTREVTFMDNSGAEITTIEVAVAETAEERNQGLMDVNSLPEDKGMLFIFEKEEPLSFWMANTPLSLDIIFVNSGMEIVRIHQNTRPFSRQNLASEQPAQYVVETRAGFCLNHDIREGMRVRF